MNILESLALGFSVALEPSNLLWCFVGVTVGTFIGALPGLGALAAISVLFPLTYHLDPTSALVMLAGIYYGTQYGGSIASILLNLPGTPSAAIVCLDGYQMAKQGRAGVALSLTAIGSFIGSLAGIILLVLIAPLLASFALRFGPAEYFAIMLLGLVAASMLAKGSPIKGLIMVLVGLVVGAVGADVQTGVPRFTFGLSHLYDGVNIVVVAMGLFGVAEIINSIMRMRNQDQPNQKVSLRSLLPTGSEMRQSVMPMARGTAVGSVMGPLPGAGGTISSFLTYALEKRVSRHPERFGRGALEGVVAPETANNAGAITSFIPLLTLGIPGDAVMALMLGAFLVNNITPGPMLLATNPELFWGLIISFLIGNILLLVLNLPLIGVWVRMLSIPYRLLYPAILLLTALGVYSINGAMTDVFLLVVFGVIGYGMIVLGYEPAPLLMGYILGPLIEVNLRRAMLLSDGNAMVFLERPISAGLLALSAMIILLVSIGTWRRMRQERRVEVR